jgi:hypothetical protein
MRTTGAQTAQPRMAAAEADLSTPPCSSSVGWLAADAGVDRAWVSELEREQGNTSIDLLDRLAMALGVPIGALFAEPDASAEKPKPLRSGRKAKT